MKTWTCIFSTLMVLGGLAAFVLVPRTYAANQSIDLAAMVPTKFANWHVLPDVQLVTAQDPDSLEHELYSQLVTRAYVDDHHHMVMLLLAYGPRQTDRLQLHRPEICYVANGFRIGGVAQATIDVLGSDRLPVKRLVASREDRTEYITYWMRIGNRIANNVLARQLIKLQYGLRGVIPDGLLIRTSSVGDKTEAYQLQDEFINALAAHASLPLRAQLLGQNSLAIADR